MRAQYDAAVGAYNDALVALPPRPVPELEEEPEEEQQGKGKQRQTQEEESRFVELQDDVDPEEYELLTECAKARAVVYANLAACHLKLVSFTLLCCVCVFCGAGLMQVVHGRRITRAPSRLARKVSPLVASATSVCVVRANATSGTLRSTGRRPRLRQGAAPARSGQRSTGRLGSTEQCTRRYVSSFPLLLSSLIHPRADYKHLASLAATPSSLLPTLRTKMATLPPKVEEAATKEKEEMMGKLKGIGDSVLGESLLFLLRFAFRERQSADILALCTGWFGLSTNNFQMTEQPGGGHSLSFVSDPKKK